jgi:acetyl esterase/lipase
MVNITKRLDVGLKPTLPYIPTIIHEYFAQNDIKKARGAYAQFVAPSFELADQIKDVICEKIVISSSTNDAELNLYVYTPSGKEEPLPVLYWIHGGGLVIGGAKMDELLLKTTAKVVGCKVVSVEYRLTPDVQFPIPLEDCYDGLKYVFDNHKKLNINPQKVALGGQSAGGGLAAALAQLVRDRKKIPFPIIFQSLIYPMLDDRNTKALEENEEDHYLWNKSANIYGWTSYLGIEPGTNKTPKYASAARMDDLKDLPPTMILVGEIDLFCLESIDYGSRLIASGVSTELHVYPGAYHGSEGMNPDTYVSQQHNMKFFSGLQRAFAK